MKNLYSVYIIGLFLIVLKSSCKEQKSQVDQVPVICVRDADTLHIRVSNNTNDTIYIPSDFTGTYNADNDTIFLVAEDQPKYNTDYYYQYSDIFPFKIYTAKKLIGQIPDTTIKIVNQTHYFNQFMVMPFISIYPNAKYTKSIVFDVPKRANILLLVYYKKSFFDKVEVKSGNYLLSDFIKFDSMNAKYVSTPIINRYYFKN